MKSKAEKMYDAVTGIDERFLEEAEAHPARTGRAWVRWVAAAAVLVLVVGLGSQIWLKNHGPASTGDGGAPNDGYYSIYAGPVLPMTALGDLDGLTATRAVTYDFSAYQKEDNPGSAMVTDRYVLTNYTDREKTLTLCYPVSGHLSDRTLSSLSFTVDGAPITPDFHLGHGIQQTKDNTLSWNEYRELLDRPGNLESSLAAEPELNQSAIVYSLAETVSGEKAEEQLTLRFRVDPAKTGIFATGFTNYSLDEQTGDVTISFHVDRRAAAAQEPCTLVLVGGDLENPELDGADHSAAEAWRLDRQEATLAAAMEADLIWITGDKDITLSQTDRAAVARLLEDGGLPTLQNMPCEGLDFVGALTSAALSQSRVMYETVEITVPAGGSVSVVACFEKEASYRTADSAQQGGEEGYDLVTRAGSELRFEAQSASVTGLDRVEIADNNFGFDPEKGITAVELDPETPCYWMHLRAK